MPATAKSKVAVAGTDVADHWYVIVCPRPQPALLGVGTPLSRSFSLSTSSAAISVTGTFVVMPVRSGGVKLAVGALRPQWDTELVPLSRPARRILTPPTSTAAGLLPNFNPRSGSYSAGRRVQTPATHGGTRESPTSALKVSVMPPPFATVVVAEGVGVTAATDAAVRLPAGTPRLSVLYVKAGQASGLEVPRLSVILKSTAIGLARAFGAPAERSSR